MFNLLCVRAAAIPRLTRLLQTTSLETQDQITLSDQLEHEQSKSQRGKIENSLRQHNLLPVVFQLFKAMGESGQMSQSSHYLIWIRLVVVADSLLRKSCRGGENQGESKARESDSGRGKCEGG